MCIKFGYNLPVFGHIKSYSSKCVFYMNVNCFFEIRLHQVYIYPSKSVFYISAFKIFGDKTTVNTTKRVFYTNKTIFVNGCLSRIFVFKSGFFMNMIFIIWATVFSKKEIKKYINTKQH